MSKVKKLLETLSNLKEAIRDPKLSHIEISSLSMILGMKSISKNKKTDEGLVTEFKGSEGTVSIVINPNKLTYKIYNISPRGSTEKVASYLEGKGYISTNR